MFVFLHGYSPDTWEAMEAAGLVRDADGIRFCQSLEIAEELKFNRLARKDGALFRLLSERKCPFYIDRLQGGCYIENYPYDRQLLDDIRREFGENFWGFQMHEWLSNHHTEINSKLAEIPADDWTKARITEVMQRKWPGKYLFLESMTLDEIVSFGKPAGLTEFYRNMTSIYRKRQQLGELIPCDSSMLAYGFELSCGTRRIMPEVGAQTQDARVQICYARGMTRRKGLDFGVYYEPWGGKPFSACMYNDLRNEWGIDENSDFPFKTAGPTGGSSRSLQRRIFLYAYLSNAGFLSEEWGLYNTFLNCVDFALSPYGQVKKEFIDFVEKYPDVGQKLTPIAAVLPAELTVLENIANEDAFCGYPMDSGLLRQAKRGVRTLFAEKSPMLGDETNTLKNSSVPDAVELFNLGAADLEDYRYLVDLTGDAGFSSLHKNICAPEDVPELLRRELPCYVEGDLHWIVNKRESGGYYLTVFNHSGVIRRVSEGEYTLPEADASVRLTLRTAADPVVLEGRGTLTREGEEYLLTVPAGDFAFIRLRG